jgi:FlaA1/EpsC-like NDP-sugar epimerase
MRQKVRSGILVLLDLILINISLLFAYLLRFDGDFNKIPPQFVKAIFTIALVASAVKLTAFFTLKLYSSLWRYAGIYEMVSTVGAAFISNAIMMSYIFLSKTPVPRSIFVIAFFTDVFLIGGVRFAYRIFRRMVHGELIQIKNYRRVLVVGGGDAGAIIIQELINHPKLKSKPIAIVDDDTTKQGRKISGVPIVGQVKDIPGAVQNNKIDEIIIAIPSAAQKELNEIYKLCSYTKCKVKILPSVSQLIDESVIMQKIRDVNIEDLLGRDPVSFDSQEISRYLSNQVVLVTGGGGSIGSELCRQIVFFNPKQLIILDNYENNAYEIENEISLNYPNLNLTTLIANIREKQRIDSIFEKYQPDVVFHAAAHKHVPLMEANPTEAIKNNVFGTLNVAEAASEFGAKKFVLISTDKAVNPTSIMGATKRIAEMVIQSIDKHSKTEFVAVRFGNVLGSNGSVIPLFKRQIEQGGPVTVTHPDIIRYFMTIPEAVQLVIQAGGMAKGGEIFVLDMGEPVKIYDLARNLIKLSGFEPEDDIKIEFTGLRPGEKLYEEILLTEEGLQTTKNKKIHIAKPISAELDALMKEIKYLKEIIMTNADGVKDFVENIVPNYKKSI